MLLSMMNLGKRTALKNSQKEYLLGPASQVSKDLALSVHNVLPTVSRLLYCSLNSIQKKAKG